MSRAVVLFDVLNTLVKERKDQSAFLEEAIRGIYGPTVSVKEGDYDGLGMKEAIERLLLQSGEDSAYVQAGLDRIMKEIPYSYYNVAGHDAIDVLGGAKELLRELAKSDVAVGLATGLPKGVVENMMERAGIDMGQFSVSAYADSGKTMRDIVAAAATTAKASLGTDRMFTVVSSAAAASASKACDVAPIGVLTGRASEEQMRQAGAAVVVNGLGDRKAILKTVLG